MLKYNCVTVFVIRDILARQTCDVTSAFTSCILNYLNSRFHCSLNNSLLFFSAPDWLLPKPLCYTANLTINNYINAGIIFISDLMFSRNNIESFNIAKDKGLIGSNYLTWSAVRCSVPKYLRTLVVDRNVLNTLEVKCGNKDLDPLSSKSKTFYALLIQENAKHSRGFYKLMSDFNLSEDETRKAFVLVKSVALETFAQCFQLKILNDILFLNTRLAKIGRIQSDLCTFCQASRETLEHFFYRCSFSTEIWTKFETFGRQEPESR